MRERGGKGGHCGKRSRVEREREGRGRGLGRGLWTEAGRSRSDREEAEEGVEVGGAGRAWRTDAAHSKTKEGGKQQQARKGVRGERRRRGATKQRR